MAKKESLITASVSVPSGTIIAYAGRAIPSGWEICDGREVNPNSEPKYRALFGAIQNIWGGNGNPNFRLPDLRNTFLRGVVTTNDVSQTGGNESHSHGGNTGGIVGGGTYGIREGGASPPAATGTDHSHHISSDTQFHLPPFVKIVYLIKL